MLIPGPSNHIGNHELIERHPSRRLFRPRRNVSIISRLVAYPLARLPS